MNGEAVVVKTIAPQVNMIALMRLASLRDSSWEPSRRTP